LEVANTVDVQELILRYNPWRQPGYGFPPTVRREALEVLLRWLSRREIVTVVGPRRTGKTTLLLQLIEHQLRAGRPADSILFLSFDEPELVELASDLGAFARLVRDWTNPPVLLLLDEVQRMPGVGRFLKRIHDSLPEFRTIVSGSAALEIQKDAAQELIGRRLTLHLLPFSAREYLRATQPDLADLNLCSPEAWKLYGSTLNQLLRDYLQWGSFPQIVLEPDADLRSRLLREIIHDWINRDALGLLGLAKIGSLQRTVRWLATTVGSPIALESLCADLKISRELAQQILQVAEASFILRRVLPSFTNPRKELIKRPKVYFVDPGLAVTISGYAELSQDLVGRLAENAAFVEFWRKDPDSVRFWRSRGGAEVDFVVEGVPVEVKFRSSREPSFSRSLLAYLGRYQPPRALVLTQNTWATRTYRTTRVSFIPLAAWLLCNSRDTNILIPWLGNAS